MTTLSGYWYQDGYVRTSSYEYNIRQLDKRNIHLTNDAVQKKNESYGKYERGNKISFDELNVYIQQNYEGRDFYGEVYPQMKVTSLRRITSSVPRILLPPPCTSMLAPPF